MEGLIPIVNKLYSLQSAYPELKIEIPQIIVVGEQSAGKSSVLESLIGRPILPRGTGIVTRCPIVIQLISEKSSKKELKADEKAKTWPWNWTSLSIKEEAKQKISSQKINEACNIRFKEEEEVPTTEEWCEFAHKKGQKFYDFKAAQHELQAEVNRRAGENQGIVEQALSLAIHSPKVINLTLVDLPGIVENPTGDQPQDIKKRVRHLLLHYMRQENSIILAVSAATSDIATSQSIQMALKVDPGRERTVAVRTKLDLVDEGTEDEVRRTLAGEILTLKRGIIGVVNRSQLDINNDKSIDESIDKERIFLEQNYPELVTAHGTPNLRRKLQQILISHIQSCVPGLETKNRKLLNDARIKLEELGEDDEAEKMEAVHKATYSIYEKFCSVVSMTEGGPIREVFEIILPSKINQIKPGDTLTGIQIYKTIRAREGTLSSKNWPMNSFQILSMEQVKRFHGPEINCADILLSELEKQVRVILEDTTIKRFPQLKLTICNIVNEVLKKCGGDLESTLKQFVAVEGAYANIEENMIKETQNLVQQMSEHEKFKFFPVHDSLMVNQVCIVRDLVEAYVLEYRRRFSTYCIKAFVVKVVNVIRETLLAQLVGKILQPENIKVLAQESPEIVTERKSWERKLAGLMEHKKIIEELRDA